MASERIRSQSKSFSCLIASPTGVWGKGVKLKALGDPGKPGVPGVKLPDGLAGTP